MRTAITIIFAMAICILTALPHLAFAVKCNPETKRGCENRVKEQHKEINGYMQKHGRSGYSEKRINTQAEKACSTDHSKRCRPHKED